LVALGVAVDNLSGQSADETRRHDGRCHDGLSRTLLKVISRTSSSRYRTMAKSSQEIGRDLGVEAIVDGSVLRANDAVRISVRLVDAATDRNIWVQAYTRKVEDVLALQADVARAIAAEIRTSFMPADQARFAAADQPAGPRGVQGRHQWNRRTPDRCDRR
jgi:TolB-like protein